MDDQPRYPRRGTTARQRVQRGVHRSHRGRLLLVRVASCPTSRKGASDNMATLGAPVYRRGGLPISTADRSFCSIARGVFTPASLLTACFAPPPRRDATIQSGALSKTDR